MQKGFQVRQGSKPLHEVIYKVYLFPQLPFQWSPQLAA